LSERTPLQIYVEDHLKEVAGWSGSAFGMLLLDQVAALQDESCHDLGAFEIGVHHGRYLIALHSACAEGTRSLGLDLFGDQGRNVDRSGSGDQDRAESNIRKFARQPDLVDLRPGDSLALSHGEVAQIQETYGQFRFSSVDAGHTAVHVVNDTKLAARLTHPAGIIIVDDFYNVNFPGVTEGVYRLLENFDVPFIPMIVTAKKLFLAHTSFANRYLVALANDPVRSTFPKMKKVQIGDYACMSVAA
jgi:hypothetical protein